jgi:hypothetical protein
MEPDMSKKSEMNLIERIRFQKNELQKKETRLLAAIAAGDEAMADRLRMRIGIKTMFLRRLRETLNA